VPPLWFDDDPPPVDGYAQDTATVAPALLSEYEQGIGESAAELPKIGNLTAQPVGYAAVQTPADHATPTCPPGWSVVPCRLDKHGQPLKRVKPDSWTGAEWASYLFQNHRELNGWTENGVTMWPQQEAV
jgi:hypothetical protein